ncbi:damage-control phosphatase ARMT1-like [Antedon mediterranea]|uniref:damage-control phosphatase ARMT1-like n=1 Tax=Antedon mediterranea TaxID=105859 RepID=UPI003AF77E79
MEKLPVVGGGVQPTSKHKLPLSLSAQYVGTFAYKTVKDRLPIILTKVIDTVYQHRIAATEQHGKEGGSDCIEIVSHLSKLKHELQTNKELLDIENDGNDDVRMWNQVLQQEMDDDGNTPRFFKSAWLYVECYMYRKIVESISLSQHLKTFDPFGEQKKTALYDCLKPATTLIQYCNESIEEKKSPDGIIAEFLQMSLWGNKCDLSISAGIKNSQKVSPLSQLHELGSKILVNKSNQIWDTLNKANLNKPVRIDFILDNAGYEFMSDLCLADCLTRLNLVDKVYFHCKAMPWFVSDVTPVDFSWTLDILGQNESVILREFSRSVKQRLDDKVWNVSTHPFWTTPHSFYSMEKISPDLHSDLAQSSLLIFKGDLNYRKLVLDRNWEHTVSFSEAINGFRPTALCSLRTLKANVVVGLQDGLAEELGKANPNWMVSGEYAVIEFAAKSFI